MFDWLISYRDWLTLGQTLTPHDVVSVAFFFLMWIGYARFAIWYGRKVPSLQGVMDVLRRTWALRMIERDNRMVDINIVRNLTRSSQFFASTTLLILGALIALLGYVQRAVDVVSELPFAIEASHRLWEIKILLLVAIFVYAFFKCLSEERLQELAVAFGQSRSQHLGETPDDMRKSELQQQADNLGLDDTRGKSKDQLEAELAQHAEE